jgi:hypothetical protein
VGQTYLWPDNPIVYLFIVVIVIAVVIPFDFFAVLDEVRLILFFVLPSTL